MRCDTPESVSPLAASLTSQRSNRPSAEESGGDSGSSGGTRNLGHHHRVRNNGTSSPPPALTSNGAIGEASRDSHIRDIFQQKRVEFFAVVGAGDPPTTAADAAARFDRERLSRPSSVVSFANPSVAAVAATATLPASFSAGDVSAQARQRVAPDGRRAIFLAADDDDGNSRYTSSVFSNSNAKVSSLAVEPSTSSDNIAAAWHRMRCGVGDITCDSSGADSDVSMGSAMNTTEAENSANAATEYEPVPSPPLIVDAAQRRQRYVDGQTPSCSYSEASESPARRVRHYVKHVARGSTTCENSPLTYASTTGYVRNVTPTAPRHSTTNAQHQNAASSSYHGSLTGSASSSAMPAPDLANHGGGSKPSGSVVTYSPSTSFSFAGGGGGTVGCGGSGAGFSSMARISGTDGWPLGAIAGTAAAVGDDVSICPLFRTADGHPMDLDDLLLLQQPILPPNSHFFCCFYKFHITAVAKVLSIVYALFYGLLCVLSYKSQHAAAFLIAVLVCFSVGVSTLYATFKWSKLCLIPFFLLQTMLVLYALVCVTLLGYALVAGSQSYTFGEFERHFEGFLNQSTKHWMIIILVGLVILTLLFCYSALLFWYEYQFIAEVDRFLKSIRRSSSQASRDDGQTQNAPNFNSKSAF